MGWHVPETCGVSVRVGGKVSVRSGVRRRPRERREGTAVLTQRLSHPRSVDSGSRSRADRWLASDPDAKGAPHPAAEVAPEPVRADHRIAVAELAEGLAHDLRNQLTVVAASVQLARELSLSREQRQLLDRAWRSAMRSAGLVDDMLRYAEGDWEAAEADAAEVLETAVAGAWRHCASLHVRLEMRAAQELPAVSGPPAALRLFLLSLLRNAAEHCPAGTRVIAQVAADGREAVLFRIEAVAADGRPVALPLAERGSGAREDGVGLHALAEQLGATLDLAASSPTVRFAVLQS